MKKTLLSIALCSITAFSFSQQQLENATFELWENVGSPSVEPEEWSSLKTADALAASAPTVIARDNGRPDAGYCLKLETKSVFGIAANGIASNGRIHADFNPENGYVFTDPANADWHTVFTSRPDSLVVWYKYAPSGNDKGKVEIALHTGAGQLPGIATSNFIGSARANFTASTNGQWMRASVPFGYASAANPEYILAVVSSGDSTMSQNGSILWVDDIQLIYNASTANLTQTAFEKSVIFITEETLHLKELPEGVEEVIIYDATGKRLLQTLETSTISFPYPAGIYHVCVKLPSGVYMRKISKF
jgi:hypothetical protein